MKILITGANGFIAKNLICELKNRGYHDLLLCSRETEILQLQAYILECDMVFHLAGANRPANADGFVKDNVEFTEMIVKHLKDNPRHPGVIFPSSIQACFDNAYGISKKRAENLLMQYARENEAGVWIYRLPNIFGKWCRPDYNSVVSTFCYHISRDQEIVLHDRNTPLTLIYIDDLVDTFIQILEKNTQTGVKYCNVGKEYHIKLEELADMIKSFKILRNDLGLPNLMDELTKKMYSTYMSYLPFDMFKYPLRMHEDNRGSFTEFMHTESSGQVSVNITKPGIMKGNHWHHTKVEKFLVVNGQALIQFRHVLTGEKVEYYVTGDKLEVVEIPTGYVHSITNIGNSELVTIIWANENFDMERPDTFYEGA